MTLSPSVTIHQPSMWVMPMCSCGIGRRAYMAAGTKRSVVAEGRLPWLRRGDFQMDVLSRCDSTSELPSSVCGLAPDSACR